MARWASFIDSKRDEFPVLLLDTGNFCRSMKTKKDKVEYPFFFEGMKRLEYDAVNVAANEIKYGRDRLLAAADEYSLPLVSTNIYDKRGQKNIGDKYMIKDLGGSFSLFGRKGGVRVGVFSLTLPLFIYEIDPAIPKYYNLTDPKIAALDAVSRLKEEGCDVIIAISYQDWTNTLAFADEIPGIDIVINGKRSHEMTYSEMVDSTLVVDTGSKRVSFTEIEVAYRLGKRFIKASELGGQVHSFPERDDFMRLQEKYKKALMEAGISTEGI